MKFYPFTAHSIPVALYKNKVIPAWWDTKDGDLSKLWMEENKVAIKHDLFYDGVEEIFDNYRILKMLVNVEARTLKKYNGYHRVMVGGFSEGAIIAMYSVIKENRTLAGCAALSTYFSGKEY